MAKILVSIKIFPTDAKIDLTALKEKIQRSLPSGSTVHKFEEEPIAFGLVALVAHIVLAEDAGGTMEQVENSIRGVDLVSEIQVLRVGRI